MLGPLPNKFYFLNVTKAFVLKLLKNMNIDIAAGIDNISWKFLKDRANFLANPISKICNLFMKYPVFPIDCQVAKLKPLYKRASMFCKLQTHHAILELLF